MLQYGLPVFPRERLLAAKREPSCVALVQLLTYDRATNQPRLTVHERCKRTILEWQHLRRKDNWTGDEWADAALVGDDHCFHPDTEMLTLHGWRKLGDVGIGEIVASRTTDGEMSWERVTETVATDYTGDLIVSESRRGPAFAVTPNHRLLVCNSQEAKRRKTGLTHFVRAGDFADGKENAEYWVPIFSKPKQPNDGEIYAGGDVHPELAYFLGFYLAEGSRSETKNRKYVHLDNKNRQLLVDIARSLGFDNEPYATRSGVFRLSLRSDALFEFLGEKQLAYEKRIPRSILESGTTEELESLLRGLMDGDGTWSQWKYDTTSEGLADDVQELCARLGMCATKKMTAGWRLVGTPSGRGAFGRPTWRVRFRRPPTSQRHFNLKRDALKKKPYSGQVVCVVVPPHHSILTRLNGRTTWIGQSFDAARMGAVTVVRETPRGATRRDQVRSRIRMAARAAARAKEMARWQRRLVGGAPGLWG
jgi:hypothetical protein